MVFSGKKRTSSDCPKTGKITKPQQRLNWAKWLFPITGFLALLWFLIRVIPKPSRATYPCQRAAFPLASSFVIWLMGLAGSAVVFRRAIHLRTQGRKILAATLLAFSVAFIWSAMIHTDQKAAYAHEPLVSNAPVGIGKGIFPGRVAWIHDSDAANWQGSDGDDGTGPYWHENQCTDPVVVSNMLSKALRSITDKSTDAEAWDAIFKDFNQQMGRGYVGYTPGQKIAIKVNMVLAYTGSDDKASNLLDQIDNSPQLAIALLKQLINVAGVAPGDICIGDAQMKMHNYWYNMVSAECPGVVYLTGAAHTQTGRTTVTFDTGAPFYWSDPDTTRFEGVTEQDYIPIQFSQCDYFINFATLKSHNDAGVTLGGKNHYGSLRNPTATGYYDMHWTRATETPGMGNYRAIVDLLGHPQLGGKTMLTLIDGLYGGRSWDSHPIRWDMAPFNGDWPSSIFLSQDPVAVDSVAFDFLHTEWDADPGDINGYPQKSGTADYLHEAALIPTPPSGVNYDPAHTGGLTQSLGVHEHWNNAIDKQYSRNLDPLNGTGIELVTDTTLTGDFYRDGIVDLKDFDIISAAWGSHPGDANWNAACDIATPIDGEINIDDLLVFFNHWLNFTLIQPGAVLEQVYSAPGINFEGPTWNPADNKLYFSRRNSPYQTLRLDAPGTVTVWQNPSPETNGTFLSNDGRLLTCDESTKEIRSLRIDPTGPGDPIVLADTSDGFTLMPNDICQLANGNIYFTTPDWGGAPISEQGVFLLEPDGTVTRLNNSLNKPNGIIASPDGSKLYVAESSGLQWWVFNIASDGTIDAGSVFFKPTNPPDPGNVPDGMTIDQFGNLYFSGLGGVWIVSPQGELLEFIDTPPILNVTFGGVLGKTLYFTCYEGVYSLDMCVHGARWTPPVPDYDPPSPDPIGWAAGGEPAAAGSHSIMMTAETPSDDSLPVMFSFQYYEAADDPNNAVISPWQISPAYQAAGLDPNTLYTFQVKARDNAYPTPNETGWSIPASARTDVPAPAVNLLDNGTFEGSGSGLLAPWQSRGGGIVELTSADAHSGSFSAHHYNKTERWHGIQIAKGDLIDLQANQTYFISAWVKVTNAGADGLAPVKITVERDDLSSGSGAGLQWYGVDLLVVNEADGWQYMEGTYTASEGTMDVSFWFEEGATMELDENGADTGTQNTDTTYAEIWVDDVYFGLAAPVADTVPPGPNPAQWAVDGEPALTANGTQITMTAATATDTLSPPVYYLFECTSDAAASSTWQVDPTYTTPKLDPLTEYTFRVKTRDSYLTPNETDWSSEAAVTTGPPSYELKILGNWTAGLTHTAEAGQNRALLLFAHAEHSSGTVTLNSVTYGDQPMAPVIDALVGTTYTANVTAFVLDEAGIAAAGNGTFVPSWDVTPGAVVYTSVFLEDADQAALIGLKDANNTTTDNPIVTNALSTEDGDMVFAAVTCGNQNAYTLNNGFTEGFDQQFGDTTTGGTAAAGYKLATGAAEIPSATYNDAMNRQVIIGFVVKEK